MSAFLGRDEVRFVREYDSAQPFNREGDRSFIGNRPILEAQIAAIFGRKSVASAEIIGGPERSLLLKMTGFPGLHQ